MATKELPLKSGPIDVVKHRWLYLGFSLLLLIPGIVFIILSVTQYPTHSPVRLGIDFTGGTILEYGFEKPIQQNDLPVIQEIMAKKGYPGSVVQIQEDRGNMAVDKTGGEANPATTTQTPAESPATPATEATKAPAVPTTKPDATKANAEQAATATETKTETATASEEKPAAVKTASHVASVVSIRSKQLQGEDATILQDQLRNQFGPLTLLQKNSIGPTLANELLTNGIIALLFAYVLIVGYLTFRFQFDYALCAIVALAHDTLTVFGLFSMMGYLFHTEVDSLFITGILTVVGFSVHDTIVVFDRLRENTRLLYSKKLPFGTIANISVNQTLARSINTSLTALLTLLALYFLGGETTREFVLTMIMGIAIGCYSSIFVASAMLAWWRERQNPRAAALAT